MKHPFINNTFKSEIKRKYNWRNGRISESYLILILLRFHTSFLEEIFETLAKDGKSLLEISSWIKDSWIIRWVCMIQGRKERFNYLKFQKKASSGFELLKSILSPIPSNPFRSELFRLCLVCIRLYQCLVLWIVFYLGKMQWICLNLCKNVALLS